MTKRRILPFLLLMFCVNSISAQVLESGDILVGTEAGVIKIDPSNGFQTGISSGTFLYPGISGIVADTLGENIYAVTLAGVDEEDRVVHVNPTNGQQTQISSGGEFFNPDKTALLNGELYVVDWYAFAPAPTYIGGAVIRVDLDSGFQTGISINGDFEYPRGLAAGRDGMLYVSDEDMVFQVDPTDGSQCVISSGDSLEWAVDIAVSEDGRMWVTNNERDGIGVVINSEVIEIDPVTGQQTVIASGDPFDTLWAISASSDGYLFVGDLEADAVFRVDPDTGMVTSISSGSLLTDGVASVFVMPGPFFTDGFESGDVSQWSASEG